MDIKVAGLTMDIMRKALDQAKKGRFEILDMMHEAIAAPRGDISKHAPRIVTIRIPTERIRDIIGPGGKMRLSRKAILKDDEGTKPRYSAEEKAAHKAAAPPEHTGFGGGRPGDGGGRGGPRGPRR